MTKVNFNKNILKKTATGVMLLSIFLSTTALIPSIIYAEEVDSANLYSTQEYNDTQNDAAIADIERQYYVEKGYIDDVEDPTKVSSSGGDSSFDAGDATKSCISSLLSTMFSKFITNKIASLIKREATTAVMSLIGDTVPVEEKGRVRSNSDTALEHSTSIQQKEVGGSVTPSMDGIAHCIGNMVIEGILQSTISWVKGGFDGNPTFVDDPEAFFTDLADYELGQMLDELSDGVLCSPWDIEIRLALLSGRRGSTSRNRCTLSTIIGNVDNFVNGNFDEGGWDGWFEMTQNSRSNPYGSYIELNSELNARITERANRVTMELNWNRGFLSMREDGEDGKITTPGSLVQEQVSSYLNIPAERLTFADEFDELIDALFNTLLSTLFEGL